MATKKDPLASALDEALPIGTPKTSKVDQYFADRPEVLESIIKARTERKLSYKQIAKVLSSEDGVQIGEGSVKNWLQAKGI